jgi:hypothetical protein
MLPFVLVAGTAQTTRFLSSFIGALRGLFAASFISRNHHERLTGFNPAPERNLLTLVPHTIRRQLKSRFHNHGTFTSTLIATICLVTEKRLRLRLGSHT